jgi:hypothetical protein
MDFRAVLIGIHRGFIALRFHGALCERKAKTASGEEESLYTLDA